MLINFYEFILVASRYRKAVMLSRAFPIRLFLSGIALLCGLLLSACAALIVPNKQTEFFELRPGEYTLDQDHAFLVFKINHLGLSSYVGQFDEIEASLQFDQDDVGSSQLDALINIGSLDINNAELEKTLLEDSGWFNEASYPQAFFSSTSVTSIDENTLVFDGDLTMLDVSAPISFTVTLIGAGSNLLTGKYTLGFSAQTSFSRATFGMNQYSSIIGDEIEIEINGEFQRQ